MATKKTAEAPAITKEEAFDKLTEVIDTNITKGFEKGTSYGMLAWVVPHSTFPAGYHCKPEEPLPFISLTPQKNFIAMYHMGLYSMPELYEWFLNEYPKHTTAKPDVGKSCIRFKKPEQIPYELIKQLVKKVTVKQWVDKYTSILDTRKK